MSARSTAYNGLAVSARELVQDVLPREEPRTGVGSAGIVLGLWLSGVFATSMFGREDSQGLVFTTVLAASVLWPLLYFVISAHFLPRSPSTGVQIALWTFVVFAGISVYVSPIVWTSLAYVLLTLAALVLALQFNSVLTADQYRRGFGLYAFVMVFLLIFFAVRNYQPGVRLGNGGSVFNPNSVGLVCLSVAAASFALNGWLKRLAVLPPTLAVLLLTDSRSAALGTAIALTVIVWARRKQMGTGWKLSLLAVMAVGAVVTVVYWDSMVSAVEAFFAVHNKYRGLGTGATGRLRAWKETWRLFTSHPLVGVGFRAHGVLVTSQSSAHNGYLATLAEIGIVGFCAVMYLVFSGIRRLKALTCRVQTASVASVMLGVCVGYCLIAIFERYLINVGNPTSLIFMLAILYYGRADERPATA